MSAFFRRLAAIAATLAAMGGAATAAHAAPVFSNPVPGVRCVTTRWANGCAIAAREGGDIVIGNIANVGGKTYVLGMIIGPPDGLQRL